MKSGDAKRDTAPLGRRARFCTAALILCLVPIFIGCSGNLSNTRSSADHGPSHSEADVDLSAMIDPVPAEDCQLPAEACNFVAHHNTVRAGVTPAPVPALPAMSWSASAAEAAVDWASQCTFKHNPELSRLGLGENLYASTYAPQASGAVTAWYAEKSNYTYSTNTCAAGQVCGHYTQLVWKTSTELGCATVQCNSGSPFGAANGGKWYFVVCDYSAPGNYVGKWPY